VPDTLDSAPHDAEKPAIAGFSVVACIEVSYLRLRAALRAALLRARVRAPLRADALRAALLLRPPFFAADFRPRRFAAAMLSLHGEVEISPTPRWNRRLQHRVLSGRELQRN
jgi:hypothetical protein